MKKIRKDGKKPYRQPEIKSQKLTLGIYGQYGNTDAADSDVPSNDHLRWSGN